MAFQLYVLILIVCINFIYAFDNIHSFPQDLNRNARFDYSGGLGPEEERSTEYWIRKAQNSLKERVRQRSIQGKAKNIILFLGDGMSISTVTAARIYKGQLENKTGEEQQLSFEKFPYVGLSKTYCVNRQVADSSCTGTAYLCGVKTNFFTNGVNAQVTVDNCTQSQDPKYQVDSIAQWAQKANKATGIVTTTTVTHASPSAAYAHVANRMWECDDDVAQLSGIDPSTCQDIASQLIHNNPGKNFNVILGGGRQKFLPKTFTDETGKPGQRLDGTNLINEWKLMHPRGSYVSNRDQLKNIDYARTNNILGLFETGNLKFYSESNKTIQPSLADMTEAAIKVLKKDKNGFFLFVEGGLIDYGNHLTRANIALDETVEMAKAVEKAMSLTNADETLIVVTSDHAHTLSISGYPYRGNDILGLNSVKSDIDGLPYTTLSYANGPQQHLKPDGKREDLTDKIDSNFQYPGTVPNSMETHAGDDVAIFAKGPQAHLFSGVMEQNLIPHIMAYTSCIGKGQTLCNHLI